MDIELPKSALYKLPAKAEFVLFIIREELKNRKFTLTLEPVGFDPTFYQHDFGTIVLSANGFSELSDELLSSYQQLLDYHCSHFEPGDDEALKTAALEVYVDLQILKRKFQ